MVGSKDNYRRTLLTNYHTERINVAEYLALSHIKDIERTGDRSWRDVLLRSALLTAPLKVFRAVC